MSESWPDKYDTRKRDASFKLTTLLLVSQSLMKKKKKHSIYISGSSAFTELTNTVYIRLTNLGMPVSSESKKERKKENKN